MAHYRKIDSRIWNDKKFNELNDKEKLLYFNLLTHPHLTMLGAMRASIPGLASELKWSVEDLSKALAQLFAKSMVKHDERASFFWLPNFLKYNRPESPNVVKSWEHALDYLPECALKDELIQHVKVFVKDLPEAFYEALPQAFYEALPQAFAKSMLNQEQEQEQNINTCKVFGETLPIVEDVNSPSNQMNEVREIFDYWRQALNHPNAKLDSKRTDKIKRALKLGYSVAQLKQAIDGCAKSPFNLGENERNQRYDDIGLILRDAEHIERFIQTANNSQLNTTIAMKNNPNVFAGVL